MEDATTYTGYEKEFTFYFSSIKVYTKEYIDALNQFTFYFSSIKVEIVEINDGREDVFTFYFSSIKELISLTCEPLGV